jgi:hypothetical protein
MPWVETFERGPCHVHLDSTKNLSTYQSELNKWLDTSACASALLLLDAHSVSISEPAYLDICNRTKKQRVFMGILRQRDDAGIDKIVQSYEPNWILPIKISSEKMQAKVDEILGVMRFTPFKSYTVKSIEKSVIA